MKQNFGNNFKKDFLKNGKVYHACGIIGKILYRYL